MKCVLTAVALLLVSMCAFGAIPLTINHQGIVKVGGEPFTGNGQFRFGFIDGAARWLWTNDGTHIGEAAGSVMPDSVVTITVDNGVYNVRLGDPALPGMVSIPATVFDTTDVRLRVIFNDGTHGAELLVPDQPMTSAPYAYQAHNADLLDGKHVTEVMPSGIITMWSGTIATIPTGWTLCNGTNGTPDLRDRFIVGARQDDAGAAKTNVKGALMQVGGEHQHVLTVDEIPSHSHTVTMANADGGSGQWSDSPVAATGSRTIGSTGGDQPHENCPPFYALAFIMKL